MFSLAQLGRWLGERAEEGGAMILPETAAEKLLVSHGRVVGIRDHVEQLAPGDAARALRDLEPLAAAARRERDAIATLAQRRDELARARQRLQSFLLDDPLVVAIVPLAERIAVLALGAFAEEIGHEVIAALSHLDVDAIAARARRWSRAACRRDRTAQR